MKRLRTCTWIPAEIVQTLTHCHAFGQNSWQSTRWKKSFLNVRFICHYIIQNCTRFLVTHEWDTSVYLKGNVWIEIRLHDLQQTITSSSENIKRVYVNIRGMKRKGRSQVATRVFNADNLFPRMTMIRPSNKATRKSISTIWAWSGVHYLSHAVVQKTPPTFHDNEMTTDGPTGMLSHI
jgi:hypothetical protein